jgi:putative PIN family toxin of toxin-antitoxin system
VGQAGQAVTRVILDTNTLVSAFLFSGPASRLVPLWQTGQLTVLVSKSILAEYYRVLAYPKFELSEAEIKDLVEEELLPYIETVKVSRRLPVVCRDPEDMKFLECAVTGRAEYLITGDKDLRSLGSYRGVIIANAGEFLQRTER